MPCNLHPCELCFSIFTTVYTKYFSTFLADFYLIKFIDDGIKSVMSRDKIKLENGGENDYVEVRTFCEAYWEDSNIKGWFESIILAFGGRII